jgi:hypothetical protein
VQPLGVSAVEGKPRRVTAALLLVGSVSVELQSHNDQLIERESIAYTGAYVGQPLQQFARLLPEGRHPLEAVAIAKYPHVQIVHVHDGGEGLTFGLRERPKQRLMRSTRDRPAVH